MFFYSFGQTIIPVSDELLLPQYMINGALTTGRTPFVTRLKLTGLNANYTYKYYVSASNSATLLSGGPGNMFIINNNATPPFGNIVGHASGKAFTPVSSLLGSDLFAISNSYYGEFTTASDGSYTGWFSVLPSGNAVFNGGNDLYPYIFVNNGFGTTVTSAFRTTSTVKSLVYNNIVNTTSCSAITAASTMPGETFVMVYENNTGTGRPLIGSWTENDGITTNFSNFNTLNASGVWSGAIPNNLPNGFNKVSYIDINGAEINNQTTSGGVWNGSSTANLTNDFTPVRININPYPLSSGKNISFFILQGGFTATISGLNVNLNVPFGTNITNLTVGGFISSFATVSPSFITPKDYSVPVFYTVTAEDLSMQTYTVNVNTLPPVLSSAKSITGFTLQGNFPSVISGNIISVTVPFGTNLSALSATGVNSPLSTVNPSFASFLNYSNPQIFTVTAQNLTTNVYTVQVAVLPGSSANSISGFTLQGNYPAIVAGNMINITVPSGTIITNLSASGTNSALSTVSPSFATFLDYSSPKTFTVTAQNLSTNVYTVNVSVLVSLSSAKSITGFTLQGNYNGVISGNIINVTVPFGTNLTSLSATGVNSLASTVNPSFATFLDYTSMQNFTVTAQDLSTHIYSVNVTTAPASSANDITSFILQGNYLGIISGNIINVTVPFGTNLASLSATGTNSLVSTVSPSFATLLNYNTAQTFTVTAQNLATNVYTVQVAVAPQVVVVSNITPIATLRNSLNLDGIPTITGLVSIAGQVYGFNSGGGTRQFQLIDATGAITLRGNTLPATLAEGDLITVTGGFNGTGINYGSFNGLLQMNNIVSVITSTSTNPRKSPQLVSVLDESTESNFIKVIADVDPLSWTGAASSYTCIITVGGIPYQMRINNWSEFTNKSFATVFGSSNGKNVTFSGLGWQFQGPRETTVIGTNNLIIPSGTVSGFFGGYQFVPYRLSDLQLPLSPANSITGFTLQGNFPTIISGNIINITVPFGTNLLNLSATGVNSPFSTVNPSFASMLNYSNSQSFTVTAQNLSTNIYSVSITTIPPSSANKITGFTIAGVSAMINGNIINVTLPNGTMVNSISAKGINDALSTVSPSFATLLDYNFPQTFTVTAQNMATNVYTVQVAVSSSLSAANSITGFTLQGNYNGVISGNIINVTVPFGTNLASLSATGTNSLVSTVSPSFATLLNYTTTQTFTVTAQNMATNVYTIQVAVLSASSANSISGFTLAGSQAIISGNIINVTVPFGTNLTALSATGTNSLVSTVSPSFATLLNYNTAQTFTVTAQNMATNVFTVQVAIAPGSASNSITGFTLAGSQAIISGNIINVTVPFGTNLTSLSATGVNSLASTVNPSFATLINYNTAQTFTVTAQNMATNVFTVQVAIAPSITGGSLNQTVAFSENFGTVTGTGSIASFNGWQNQSVIFSSISGVNPVSVIGVGNITTSVAPDKRSTFPSSGYSFASAISNIYFGPVTSDARTFFMSNINTSTILGNVGFRFGYTRNSATIDDLRIAYSTDNVNYTEVTYTSTSVTGWQVITIPNNTLPKSSTLSLMFFKTSTASIQHRIDDVQILDVPIANISSANSITGFQLAGIPAVISGNIINVTVPFGTNLTSLSATGSISPLANVNPSFATLLDYSTAKTFTVTAQNLATNVYTVNAVVSATLSDANSITGFTLQGGYQATINGNMINLTVPFGTNLSSLSATGTNSLVSTVNPSFATLLNYSTAQTFTVTAQNLATNVYTVNVTIAASVSGVVVPYLSLSTLRASLNASGITTITGQFTTSGQIYGINAFTTGQQFSLIDATGAITLRTSLTTPAMKEGDIVTITGGFGGTGNSYGNFNGLQQVTNITSITIGSSNNPRKSPTLVSELTESLESDFVSVVANINRASWIDAPITPTLTLSGFTVIMTVNGVVTQLRISNMNTEIYGKTFEELFDTNTDAMNVTISGLVGQFQRSSVSNVTVGGVVVFTTPAGPPFNAGYQLIPYRAADIKIPTATSVATIQKQLSQIAVYPNPSNGVFYLNKIVQSAIVSDISGRVIATFNQTNTIDLTQFTKGLYILYINDSQRIKIVKE